MDTDQQADEGTEDVIDNADVGDEGDQSFGSPEDAIDALEDDETVEEETEDDGDKDSEEQPDEAEDEGDQPQDGDDVLVDVGNGQQIPVGELRKGYMLQQDYTAKTTEVARQREAVQEAQQSNAQQSQFLQNAYGELTEFIQSLIPAAPDASLAQSNPGAYLQQQALRDGVANELQSVLSKAQNAQSLASNVSQQAYQQAKAENDVKLVEAFPNLKDAGQRVVFDRGIAEAAKEFGFTEQEASQVVDHRVLSALHYARIGKQAEHNRKNAKRRVAEKPRKGTPNKGTRPATSSRNAMANLAKSGSFEDAMKVDFLD